MGRIEIDEFSDKKISRICIATSVEEAKQIEDRLTENSVDFAVSLEPYIGSILLSQRNGIAFYVLSGQEQYCRKLLANKGLSSGDNKGSRVRSTLFTKSLTCF